MQTPPDNPCAAILPPDTNFRTSHATFKQLPTYDLSRPPGTTVLLHSQRKCLTALHSWSVKARPLLVSAHITPGRQNIKPAPGGNVATLGHNDIALVIQRREMRVRLVASTLYFSPFHNVPLLLFFPVSSLPFVINAILRRPPLQTADRVQSCSQARIHPNRSDANKTLA